MATLAKGYAFGATEQITNEKLHNLVDNGTISGILNADVSAAAAIAESKIAFDGSTAALIAGDNTFSGDNTFAGTTIADLGTVTTADINGGTLDGVQVGGTTATGELLVNNSSDAADGLGSQGTAGQVLTSAGAGANPTWSVALPSGCIVLWSGAISAIPSGFVICDGTNSTPDLTDRFVIHADADSGGTNDVGDTGGASTVTLTSAQSGVPAHTHGISGGTAGNDGTVFVRTESHSSYSTSQANVAANAAEAHSNRDKYYALAYIMKI